MHEFRISKKAAQDIQDISLYTTHEFGDRQAFVYKEGMLKVFKKVSKNPDLGRDTSALLP